MTDTVDEALAWADGKRLDAYGRRGPEQHARTIAAALRESRARVAELEGELLAAKAYSKEHTSNRREYEKRKRAEINHIRAETRIIALRGALEEIAQGACECYDAGNVILKCAGCSDIARAILASQEKPAP